MLNKEQIACVYIKAPWNLLLVFPDFILFFPKSRFLFFEFNFRPQVPFVGINTVPIDIMLTESGTSEAARLCFYADFASFLGSRVYVLELFGEGWECLVTDAQLILSY